MAQALLRVRVRAQAKENRVVGLVAGVVRLQVTAPPEKGKANAAVVELLARYLGLPRRDVQVIQGATSGNKVVRVPLSEREVLRRLGLTGAG